MPKAIKKAVKKPKPKAKPKKGKKMEKVDAIEVSEKKELTTDELIGLVKDILEDNKAGGFMYCLIGSDNKVIPFVGARSVEQLLLMQKIIGLEVDRIFTSVSTQAPQA